jgi:hypothetical protein
MVTRGSGPVFMFCTSGLIFGGTVGVGSRFHVLRACTLFLLYRGSQIPFSCFARPDSFSAVPRVSGPVYMFCAPGPVFGGNSGVGSRFHVLRARTHFLRKLGRRVPFSCFARPHLFSALPRASGSIFMFCAPRFVFGLIEGVGSHFHLFARPDSFLAVPRASAPVFMFCALGVIFGRTEGVRSLLHVLHSRTRFWLYRGNQIPFSCFARPDSFSAVPGASGPVYMFRAPGLVFGGNEGVGSRFQVLRTRIRFLQYRGRQVPFSCFARPDSFSAILRASGPVLMNCGAGLLGLVFFIFFARPHTFSALPRTSGSVFTFCMPRIVFGCTEGVGSRFHLFARTNSFFAVPRASAPVFMSCALGLVFGRTEGVWSRFWERIFFIFFARLDSFLAVLRTSAPGLIFCGTEGIRSRFHVLLARIRFRHYRGR